MAGTQLTPQNATITTATIQIQALTIGKKQVTLAVFRQLREQPLIAEDGTLTGEPWGVVNYHPDKCNHDDHWHVVWQRDTELLRAWVSKRPDFDPANSRYQSDPFTGAAVSRYVTSHVLEWLNGNTDRQTLKVPSYLGERVDDEVTMGSPHGFNVTGYASKAAITALAAKGELERRIKAVSAATAALDEPPHQFSSPERREQELARAQTALAEAQQEFETASGALIAEVTEWGTHSELSATLTETAKAEADRRERHRAARAEIAELPQLFIAV